MKYLEFLLLLVAFLSVYSLPVKENVEESHPEEPQEDWETNLEYGRYLKEVVNALESDQEFRKKLDSADPNDIKTGKIAQDLHFVDHNVRTKLDELKRSELERLRHIAVQEHEKRVGVDRTRLKIPSHVDHRNPSRFESEDLRKLISQLNRDLEEADKKRQKEFKEHELGKEFEYQQQLKGLDDEHQKQKMQEHDEAIKKHKDHPKLHHPGSKLQLEEVWEEQDHMQSEDFDPKTFFHLHDLDGNGEWDQNEVKALFQKELDKMYDPNAPEDDIMERYEEMERMREHIFKESDLNQDNFISFAEFMEQTKKTDFERDEGWDGLDQQELYSPQEYEQFERQRNDEIRRLVESGAIAPPPGFDVMGPPSASMHHDPNSASAMAGVPLQAPSSYGVHPNAIPEAYQAVPQGYQGHQAVPQGYQAVPQGYQAVPQGHQAVPQGYQAVPQGYQAVPQGYQAVPQGYQAVPQGYQAVPQGYQDVPQGHQAVPQGHHAVPQGYQAAPQIRPEAASYQQGNLPPPVPQQPNAQVGLNQVKTDVGDKKIQVQGLPPHNARDDNSLQGVKQEHRAVDPIESNRIPRTK